MPARACMWGAHDLTTVITDENPPKKVTNKGQIRIIRFQFSKDKPLNECKDLFVQGSFHVSGIFLSVLCCNALFGASLYFHRKDCIFCFFWRGFLKLQFYLCWPCKDFFFFFWKIIKNKNNHQIIHFRPEQPSSTSACNVSQMVIFLCTHACM